MPRFAATVRNVVVVGIHGWTLFGNAFQANPIQTSAGFCRLTRRAFVREMYAQAGRHGHAFDEAQLNIHTVPLSGHGKVHTRVERYMSEQLAGKGGVCLRMCVSVFARRCRPPPLLAPRCTRVRRSRIVRSPLPVSTRRPACTHSPLSSHTHADTEHRRQLLRNADVIIFACHSQGCMVGVLLLHALLQEGLITPATTRINLLCMAGIHHGPYPDIITDLFGSTQQLFAYTHPHSPVAQEHVACAQTLLEAGVKMAAVASWGDQVVPLFSALLHR
jgi:hypothetical protein